MRWHMWHWWSTWHVYTCTCWNVLWWGKRCVAFLPVAPIPSLLCLCCATDCFAALRASQVSLFCSHILSLSSHSDGSSVMTVVWWELGDVLLSVWLRCFYLSLLVTAGGRSQRRTISSPDNAESHQSYSGFPLIWVCSYRQRVIRQQVLEWDCPLTSEKLHSWTSDVVCSFAATWSGMTNSLRWLMLADVSKLWIYCCVTENYWVLNIYLRNNFTTEVCFYCFLVLFFCFSVGAELRMMKYCLPKTSV